MASQPAKSAGTRAFVHVEKVATSKTARSTREPHVGPDDHEVTRQTSDGGLHHHINADPDEEEDAEPVFEVSLAGLELPAPSHTHHTGPIPGLARAIGASGQSPNGVNGVGTNRPAAATSRLVQKALAGTRSAAPITPVVPLAPPAARVAIPLYAATSGVSTTYSPREGLEKKQQKTMDGSVDVSPSAAVRPIIIQKGPSVVVQARPQVETTDKY